jgi:hypothetical protein
MGVRRFTSRNPAYNRSSRVGSDLHVDENILMTDISPVAFIPLLVSLKIKRDGFFQAVPDSLVEPKGIERLTS